MTESSTSPIRVAIVDDQEIVRSGLRMILGSRSEVEVVGEGADGSDVPELIIQSQPEVILMDLRMPRIDGIEATRRLHSAAKVKNFEPPKVLVLTTFDLDEHVFSALQAGASAFLVKDSPVEDLLQAIEHVHHGDAVVQPRITRQLVEHFVNYANLVTTPLEQDKKLSLLTAREQEVLKLVAAGLSNTEIATSFSLSEVTVKSHVGRILTKLSLRNRTQAVVFAYETGFVRPHSEGSLNSDTWVGSQNPSQVRC